MYKNQGRIQDLKLGVAQMENFNKGGDLNIFHVRLWLLF